MTVDGGTQVGKYVELAGVRVWYDENGQGDPLVLLHGGFSDSRDFSTNLAGLSDAFRVFRFDRRGHGRTGDVPGPISHQVMAEDAARFVETVAGGPVRLVGYNDGPPAYADHELAGLGCRTLVLTGDDDLIKLEHSVALYRALPDAELAIMPGTSHTLLIEKPELCTAAVRDFLANDPVPTYIPIRRAATP